MVIGALIWAGNAALTASALTAENDRLQQKLQDSQQALTALQAKPPDVLGNIDSMPDSMLADTKAKAGTAAALAMLNDGRPFDVLKANLLLAKDLPDCSSIDIMAIDRWYTATANQIRSEIAQRRLLPKYQKIIAEQGEPDFLIICATLVFNTALKVGYVDNDVVRHDLPWHTFVHGIPEYRKGNCITLTLAWKILADKLGWPMKLRLLPGHTNRSHISRNVLHIASSSFLCLLLTLAA